jgi:hypothetical protein
MSGSSAREAQAQSQADSGAAAAAAAGAAAPKKQLNLDAVGCVLVVVAITCFALAITWGGGTYDWSDGRIVALLVVAGVFAALFSVWELYYAVAPVMPLRLFGVRNFACAAWIMFWSGFGMMAMAVYLPVYFQLVWGEDATQSGIALIPMMLAFPFGSMGAGISMSKTGTYYFQPIIGSFFFVAGGALMTTFTETTPFAQRIGFLILGGLACGLTIATPTATAQAAVLGKDRATTTSTVSFFGVLGRLCASAAGQTIMNNNFKANFADLASNAIAAARSGSPWTPAQLAAAKTHVYSISIAPVFWLSVAAGALLLAGAVFVQHIPLSGGHGAPKPAAPAAAEKTVAVEADADAPAKDASLTLRKADGAEGAAAPPAPASEDPAVA